MVVFANSTQGITPTVTFFFTLHFTLRYNAVIALLFVYCHYSACHSMLSNVLSVNHYS